MVDYGMANGMYMCSNTIHTHSPTRVYTCTPHTFSHINHTYSGKAKWKMVRRTLRKSLKLSRKRCKDLRSVTIVGV